ncbi:DUF72 domain-containing protein [Candidatus Pyrohabitans sp.]
MIKVGCCGFPGGMSRYFQEFSLVEVQRTFYSPPRVETAQRWRSLAGEDFEFTLKAWQLITHPPGSPTYRKAGIKVSDPAKYGFFKPTEEVFSAWEKTEEVAQALKASVIVFQCPPRFTQSEEHISNLKSFFDSIERGSFTFALELRSAWERGLLAELCEELKLVHCVDPLREEPVTRRLAYFRLHGSYKGGRINYRHRYSDEELREVAEKAQRFESAYVLFNNVYMGEDASRFINLLRTRRSFC